MAWIRNESGSIVPFRRSILPNKPFLATLRCLSLSPLPFARAANSLWNQVVHVRRWRRRRRLGDRESGRDNIFPRLDLIKSAPVRRDERGEPHGSPALQTSKQKKGWCTPRRPSAARQMQFYASLSLVSSPPPPLLCLHRRARDPRDFTRGSRGGDATVLSTDDASENREERLARRCLFDYGGERALRLMFARWIRRWLKGGKDLGWYFCGIIRGRNYFVILDWG